MRHILTFISIVLVNWPALSATVSDADTLTVNGVIYRLDGIDAPEAEQLCLDQSGQTWQCGIAARQRMIDQIANRTVSCEDRGQDPAYTKRRIGVCRIDGEAATINQWLVREGLAINFEPYARGRYTSDEQQAREAKRGMWAGCFAAPRDFRRGNRDTAPLQGSACPEREEKSTRLVLFPKHPSEPAGCPIKATTALRARVVGYAGIYYVPGCPNYARTQAPRRWFCSEDDAQAAGFRKAYTC